MTPTSEHRFVAVVDIGKTNAKLVVVDPTTLTELSVHTTPNRIVEEGPYPHHDTDDLWSFVIESLNAVAGQWPVDAVTVTAHGASAVLLDRNGNLALPMLDYEHTGPEELAEAYDRMRPDFSETGSPRLTAGLNLGAQIFWQFETFPALAEHVSNILTYPQYWAYRLSGVRAIEVTSLGCHTDLWNPFAGTPSTLVTKLGLKAMLPDLRRADEKLGTLLPDISAATGLAPDTQVYCGIHDSNASLIPHLRSRMPPFSVVSTGTWVIAMVVGGRRTQLDPERDTLINVNAFGDPVPSARFMGGREFDILLAGRKRNHTPADMVEVLQNGIMLFPAVEMRSGPFRGRSHRWSCDPEQLTDGQYFVATSFYLALMTATCLQIAGGDGKTVLEGPFAKNRAYALMLEAATGRPVETSRNDTTGTSIGAALLTLGKNFASRPDNETMKTDQAMIVYARRWAQATGRV